MTQRTGPAFSAAARYAHRMETIGQLAAGIAHEINTPVQFIGDSVSFLTDTFAAMAPLLRTAARVLDEAPEVTSGEAVARDVRAAAADAELGYVVDEIPLACDRAATGIQRVADLARAIVLLSQPGTLAFTTVDLNRIVETVLVVSRNEYKYVADVTLDLASLPAVRCAAADITHALLLLVLNAAQAIGARGVASKERGQIAIRTWHGDGCVRVSVSDGGVGIPEAVRARVFDPCFTTTPAGQHLGRGLAVARDIVVEDHAGTLTFVSATGTGTTFEMALPVGEAERQKEHR